MPIASAVMRTIGGSFLSDVQPGNSSSEGEGGQLKGTVSIAAANQYIPTGTLLTATLVGSWIPAPTYQWYRGATFGGGGALSPIAAATSSTYTTVGADTGYDMVCKATNVIGTSTSNTLIAEIDVTAPVLAWTVSIGNSPTITPGTWTDSPVLVYDLYRDGVVTATVNRTLAQANAYVAVANDVGPSLTWLEKDVAAGLSVSTNALSVAPTITIAANADFTTLTATASGAGTTLQWKRAGSSIGSATATTYATTGNDGSSHTDYGPSMTCVATAAGGSTTSNALAYTPAVDSCTWFQDPATLANGAVASWPDATGNVTLAQATGANQPVKSATSINGTPGVTFDGSNDYLESSATLALATPVFALVEALVDTAVNGSLVLYFTDPPSQNAVTESGFASAVNLLGAGRVEGYAHGGGGNGAFGSTSAIESLATACVLTTIFDTSIATGVAALRKNGVALSLLSGTSLSTSGNFGTRSILHGIAGNRSANAWAGTKGCSVGIVAGTATAAVKRVEQFVAWRTGMVPL